MLKVVCPKCDSDKLKEEIRKRKLEIEELEKELRGIEISIDKFELIRYNIIKIENKKFRGGNEMDSINIELGLEVVDVKKEDTLTFRELLEMMSEEVEAYRELGQEEDLLNSPIIVSGTDSEGSVVDISAKDLVGFLESGATVITGEISFVCK